MKFISISALWCSSCLIMKKTVKELEEIYPQIEFITYDLDFDEESKKYQITSKLPVYILIKDNIETKRIIGEQKKDVLIQNIEDYLIKE